MITKLTDFKKYNILENTNLVKPPKLKFIVRDWLEEEHFNKYTIDSDGYISIIGNVYIPGWLVSKREKKLICKFKIITGDFDCSRVYNLKSLEGCPEIVHGNFDCSRNYSLKSLKHCPKIIKGHFYCQYNNKLKTISNSCIQLGKEFIYSNNYNIRLCIKNIIQNFINNDEKDSKIKSKLKKREIELLLKNI